MEVQGLPNTSLALEHQAEVESQTQREHAQGERDNLQSIKHRTQIMKAKYFCILAYKHETDYKGLSHRQRGMAINGAIYRRVDQPWSNREENYSLGLKILKLVDLYKMVVCWFI